MANADPFSLHELLDSAQGLPEDFEEYNKHREVVADRIRRQARDDGVELVPGSIRYPGYMRYLIIVNDARWEVIARRRNNGTYQIKEARCIQPL